MRVVLTEITGIFAKNFDVLAIISESKCICYRFFVPNYHNVTFENIQKHSLLLVFGFEYFKSNQSYLCFFSGFKVFS